MKKILNEQLSISSTTPLKARFYDYSHFTYPWHFHGEYEFIYVEKGKGQCLIGDSLIDFDDNTLILFGSELPHCMQNLLEYETDESLRVNGAIIQFEKDFMYYAFSHYSQFTQINDLLKESQRGIKFSLENDFESQSYIKNIVTAEGALQIISLLSLLHRLTGYDKYEFAASPDYEQEKMFFKDRKMQKLIAFLNTKYTSRLSLEDIASFMAMNPTAFCRYFKNNTGKTLGQYIMEMRISYACKLLSWTDMPVGQIAYECGYDNMAHFDRYFKTVTSQTPSAYQKKFVRIRKSM